jgi:hypothetical protein
LGRNDGHEWGDPMATSGEKRWPLTRLTPQPRAIEKSPDLRGFLRADAGTRTPDPFITSEVLYQLSYVGVRRPV